MIPVSNAYRQAIFEALDGNVIYGGDPIPVVSAIAERNETFYIVMEGNSVSGISDKQKFASDATITIEIVDYQTRRASYKAVNEIYALILAILIPSPYKAGFAIGSPFQAECVEVVSEEELFEQTFDKIVRKIFRIKAKIVQNS